MDLGDRALHEPTSGVTGWRLPKAGQTVNGSKMCGQRTAYPRLGLEPELQLFQFVRSPREGAKLISY
jgi:hypothetical protein